jgi:hypothetical protein
MYMEYLIYAVLEIPNCILSPSLDTAYTVIDGSSTPTRSHADTRNTFFFRNHIPCHVSLLMPVGRTKTIRLVQTLADGTRTSKAMRYYLGPLWGTLHIINTNLGTFQ